MAQSGGIFSMFPTIVLQRGCRTPAISEKFDAA